MRPGRVDLDDRQSPGRHGLSLSATVVDLAPLLITARISASEYPAAGNLSWIFHTDVGDSCCGSGRLGSHYYCARSILGGEDAQPVVGLERIDADRQMVGP